VQSIDQSCPSLSVNKALTYPRVHFRERGINSQTGIVKNNMTDSTFGFKAKFHMLERRKRSMLERMGYW
jgi:hypothetical protein